MNNKQRRNHTKKFKEEAVKLVSEQGYAISEAARNLGLNPNLLGRLKLEREILKKEVVLGNLMNKFPVCDSESLFQYQCAKGQLVRVDSLNRQTPAARFLGGLGVSPCTSSSILRTNFFKIISLCVFQQALFKPKNF